MASGHYNHKDNLKCKVYLNEKGQKEEAQDATDDDIVGITAGKMLIFVHETE